MKDRPITMKALGEWDHDIGVPLATALAVSVETTGKTGAEACARAMVMMAQTARKLTPTSAKKRTVINEVRDGKGPFVIVWNQSEKTDRTHKIYRFQFNPRADQVERYLDGTWQQAQQIKSAGLAKRSWFWGLRGLPGAPSFAGKAIRGVTTLFTIIGNKTSGYELTDRVKYLSKILPDGWKAIVEKAASDRIMNTAKSKIQQDWRADMRRSARAQSRAVKDAQSVVVDVSRFFLKVAS